MDRMTFRPERFSHILFLAWEYPWPPHGGGALRTLGLLEQLCNDYLVDLIVLSQKPPKQEQEAKLLNYVRSIVRVPMAGVRPGDKARIAGLMLTHRMPYHSARLELSFRRAPDVLRKVRTFPGIVYANYGHWGTLIRGFHASNWILDQHNADIDFWRVYASQATSLWRRTAALVNWRLAAAHFPRIYSNVGRIISVCEADRQLTIAAAPDARVDVIENGVDCSYYTPGNALRYGQSRLLFTGTSAPRNVTALRRFAERIWPIIRCEMPQLELLVAGNFTSEAQAKFEQYEGIRFTGWVEDIRPFFDQSDVFIAPFDETHGSKLKIAEAMAMEMPIVSTPQGVRGFPLVDKESVLIAHDPEEFAAYVLYLLRDSEVRVALGRNARQVALTRIDWPILGKRLNSIVRDMLEGIDSG